MGICQSSSSPQGVEEEELQSEEDHASSEREMYTSETRIQLPNRSCINQRFHQFGLLSDDVVLEM